MSKIQSPGPPVTSNSEVKAANPDAGLVIRPAGIFPEPTPQEFAVLTSFERFAFRLVRRMNHGNWKRFWTWCQKTFGAGWIHFATYNLMQVYGLENVHAVSTAQPILLVANHRSFFDMYTVSTVLFRNTSWRKQLFFPVRGRFFYQGPLGLFVNLVMGWRSEERRV